MLLPEPRMKNGTPSRAGELDDLAELVGVLDRDVGVCGAADADGRVARERLVRLSLRLEGRTKADLEGAHEASESSSAAGAR